MRGCRVERRDQGRGRGGRGRGGRGRGNWLIGDPGEGVEDKAEKCHRLLDGWACATVKLYVALSWIVIQRRPEIAGTAYERRLRSFSPSQALTVSSHLIQYSCGPAILALSTIIPFTHLRLLRE